MNALTCRDVALLFPGLALGRITPEESARLVLHLHDCADCRRGAAEHARVVLALRAARDESDAHDLHEELRVAVLADFARRRRGEGEALRVLEAPLRSGWRATEVVGVSERILHEDPSAGRKTALYRMEPGSAYPPHRHAGVEECWILEGDLAVSDRVLRAGAYQRSAKGSVHTVQSTEGGCLLLVNCSTADERF